MSTLTSALRLDMRRALSWKRILTASLVVFLVYMLNMRDDLGYAYQGAPMDVLYLYMIARNSIYFSMLIFPLAALPYATSFCVDWKYQFIRPMVMRSSVNGYAWSKVFSTALSGGLAIVIANVILLVFLSAQFPIVLADADNMQSYLEGAFGSILGNGQVLFYLACMVILLFFIAAFLSVFALYISAYIPNVFVVMVAPLLGANIWGLIIGLLRLPTMWGLDYLAAGNTKIGEGVMPLLIFGAVFIILIFLFGFLFVRRVQRRLQNG